MTNPYDPQPPSGYYPPTGDPSLPGGTVPTQPYGPPSQFGSPPGFGGTTAPGRGGFGGRLPGVGRPWRRRHTLGCFGSLVALALLVLVIQVAFTPWAFHIGGTFTPLMNWTGVATGHTPSGSSYAVRLSLQANTISDRACSQYGCDDVHGTVDVCTSAGQYTFINMSGKVGGWLSTDGQKMTIGFSHGKDPSTRNLEGTLTGTWHGKVYQASDGGYLDRDFDTNGTPRTEVTSADPHDAATLAFQPGDFTAACDSVKRH